MSVVFGRDVNAGLPIAVRGDGIHLYDASGKRYIDACGGAAVSCLGHGNREVTAAIKEQLDALAYAHTGTFTSEPQEELGALLVSDAPPGLGHAYFVTGGSEAMEAAIKLARQYHVERGEPCRTTIVSREFSYHGNTLGALAASGHHGRRSPYEPMLMNVPRISACFPYRGMQPDETPVTYGARVAAELEACIVSHGADTIAAFVAETVVGATLGAAPPVPGYFARIREICSRYRVLLILDEVMCGMGRTGTLHACEQERIVPDILAVAKGLGAGYAPVGALLIGDAIHDAIARGSGSFVHGHTYMGHPAGCAGALAVQRIIRRDGLIRAVAERGVYLETLLRERFAGHRAVGDIRGRGLLWGLEFVSDLETNVPFDRALHIAARIKNEAMALGLICYPGVGTVDGILGDHVLLAPPFNVSIEELDRIVDLLAGALDAVFAQVAA